MTNPSSRPNRRQVVKAAAVSAAFPWVMTRSGLAGASTRANSTLGIGVIGIGIRGKNLMRPLMQRDDTRIVAVCDVAGPRLMRGMRMVEEMDGEPCAAYLDFLDMLQRGDLDAVVIATPDHQHAFEAVHAADAGKHIYCEKPLTLTIPEGRAICNAVERNGVTFQTGSQQRTEYGRKFVDACEHVRSGRIGTLQRIEVGVGDPPLVCDLPAEDMPAGYDFDRWLGQAPERAFNAELCPVGVHGHYPKWRAYREYCNGYFADMGAHHYDIAQWGMDADHTGPVKVIPPARAADGTMPKRGLVLEYADGVQVSHGGRSGTAFYGTDGWIWVDRGALEASDEAILKDPRGADEVTLPRHANHLDNWIKCLRGEDKAKPICHEEVGHRTASVNQLAVIGYETGKTLHWDPQREFFVGDDAQVGNDSLTRPVRDGWQLPGCARKGV
ncbi:MAG: Gfo/Idh/MocA family oxidoreductase [Phycisphaerales bacterium]|nr:Gfo/Idh/MocA family oxidoreductase [Phycisphaerales bacterium]